MGQHAFNGDRTYELHFPDGDYIGGRITALASPYENLAMRALESLLPRGARIVDVGANIGNHAVFWAAGGARVTAFEPGHEALRWLRENVARNDLDGRVSVIPCAVGASSGRSSLSASKPGNLGATTFEVSEDGDVPLIRLDEHAFDRVDAIKIDVEGHEHEVLEGSRALLRTQRPIIMLEAWSPAELKRLERLLRPQGYRRFPLRIGGGPTYLFLPGRFGPLNAARSLPVLKAAFRVVVSDLRSGVRRRR